ncbi:penicillin-binding protein 2 [uncultured Clostridium sp.]|jgi:penicillin-binding protein 2|uniref:peptidoglycan D,D-transpeptidase FtsI family protein n=1 Tax=uncultured Clostridium sp. TaxID=59620 RepID=UPI0026147493|nr:penicillin-binding transpeptidase domain-containing protein [uncultured Clostridium sp.]
MKRVNNKKKKPVNRFKVLTLIALIVFGAILARLVYLQIFDYDNLRAKANIRSTRFMPEQAPRGKIYSQDGDLLATNKEAYMLTFTKTSEGMIEFYNTINSVLSILKENNAYDKIDDNFNLKINPQGKLYFDFPVSETDKKLWNGQKLRFMYDRSLEGAVENKLYPKNNGKFTDEQMAEVGKVLAAYTPDETFDILAKEYGLYNMLNIGKTLTHTEQVAFDKKYKAMSPSNIMKELLKTYSLTEVREFMLVKDDMKLQSYSGFKPIKIASNIGEKTAYIFYQKLSSLPGIEVEKKPVRYYPYGTLASHVLGYMGAIPANQANKYDQKGYDVSADLVGVSGIESSFENILRGRTGGDMVKVNSAGQKVGSLYQLEAYPGNNVHLTIDADIQYAATKMLQTQMDYIQKNEPYGKNARMGAVVAVDVKTGGILALASLPNYNPNDFASGKVSMDVVKKYFNLDVAKIGQEFIKMMGLNKTLDEMFPENSSGGRSDKYDVLPKPLFNYATMGLVPPGSTFKPVTATAALETGVTNASYTVTDSPTLYYHAEPNIFGNNLPKDNNDHGVVDIVKAIQVSCNNYFYNMAAKLYYHFGKTTEALDVIGDYAAKYGLGTMPGTDEKKGTGIEIPENFGNAYNFEDFKSSSIFYSKWTLVDSLKAGHFDAVNIKFAPIDIGVEKTDTKEASDAKAGVKKVITDQLDKVGKSDVQSAKAQDEFEKALEISIKKLYTVSPTVKSSIDNWLKNEPKVTVDENINATARAIDAWVAYTMYTTITTPAQLGYAAIGQGTSEFTPLQIAGYVSTLANGGTRYKLHLLDEVTTPAGQVVEKTKPEVIDKVNISKQNLDLIKQGMYNVNNNPHGTGYYVFGEQGFPIPSAGKTGTASLTSGEHNIGRSAWGVYISFAPVENPQIAVAVVIYNGIHGYLGAPVARAIYETYFRNEIKTKYPNYHPKTMAGVPYDYTLNPPLPKITDKNASQNTSEANK